MEAKRRLSGRQVGHLEILPGDAALPARADGFHARFLGREARRIAFVTVGLTFYVSDLPGGIDAIHEARSVALDGGADAWYLRQIHTGAHDHFNSDPVVVMVSRPCFTPLVLMRASATLRTSADF